MEITYNGRKIEIPDYNRKFVAIEGAARQILEALGIDGRDGTKDTPKRFARMMLEEMTLGLNCDPRDILSTTFDSAHDEIIAVHDIPFYSMCEHHLVPFFGKAHVGYIPGAGQKIVGLSKIARVVDIAARKPGVQENLTQEIADAMDQALRPDGVIVVVQARHLCMGMRGIRTPDALTTTSVVRGLFRDNPAARQEFLKLTVNRRSE